MTFKQFQNILADQRPEIITCCPHGKFGFGSATTLTSVDIRFSENGRVYNYRGTYGQILEKLGVIFTSKQIIAELEQEIAAARRRYDNPICFFFETEEEIKDSELKRIAELEQRIADEMKKPFIDNY